MNRQKKLSICGSRMKNERWQVIPNFHVFTMNLSKVQFEMKNNDGRMETWGREMNCSCEFINFFKLTKMA